MKKLQLICLPLIVALTACQSDLNAVDSTKNTNTMVTNKHMSAEILGYSECPIYSEPTLKLIQKAEDWIELQNNASSRSMSKSAQKDMQPEFDLGSRIGVLVSLGMKPTPGYALRLENPVVPVENGVARITLHSTEPAPGSIMAQMITHPCLLVSIERDNYKAIQVMIEGKDSLTLERVIPL